MTTLIEHALNEARIKAPQKTEIMVARLDDSSIPSDLMAFAQLIALVVNSIPEEHRKDAKIEFNWDGYDRRSLTFSYWRMETTEETKARAERQLQAVNKVRNRTREKDLLELARTPKIDLEKPKGV